MSCRCGATRIEDCATLAELDDSEIAGADDKGGKVHRALWCLLHPLQCRRDPKTGAPIPAVGDLLLLGGVIWAWWALTRE